MKKSYLIFPLLLFFGHFSRAQTFSSEERRKEVEDILNIVINSSPFDSVYSQKRVYILANELLMENSPLALKRNKCKAKFLNEEGIKKVKQYIVLGDFTLDWNNPIAVRVQLSISTNKTLNIRLEKENGNWIIRNHMILED